MIFSLVMLVFLLDVNSWVFSVMSSVWKTLRYLFQALVAFLPSVTNRTITNVGISFVLYMFLKLWYLKEFSYTWSWFFQKFSTHFKLVISFDTPWKHQKPSGFLMFQGVSKEITSMKWVNTLCVPFSCFFSIKLNTLPCLIARGVVTNS